MKPILYEKTETAFTSNGLGRINCLRLDVKEDRNGLFELEMDVDIDDPLFSEITEERVVATIHDDTKEIQPFDIYARTEPISGVVTFYGRHISYRLGKNVCMPFTAQSCVAAMNGINQHVLTATGFTFWTDIASVKSFAIKQPTSVRSVLGGVEGSILDTFGGEYKWDKFTVKLYGDRGNDNGVTIRYGVNLTGFDRATDDGETYNAVAPFWQSEENLVTLTEGYVAVEGTLPEDLKIVPLDLSDQFDSAPTQAQLRARATSVLNGSANLKMKESIDIDFVALWQTSEYESVAPLQRLSLCDIATVVMRGRKYRAKIVSVTYDALAERYKSMTLGEARASFVGALRAEVEEVAERVSNAPTTSMMQAAIDYATELIRGGLGGHVVISTNADGEPEEILIMDTDDVATAVNVWRFNLAGLAHSSNGYNGPFADVALTADGHINGQIITAGSVNANVMTAGILKDQANKNSWNLDTGDFTLSAGTTVGGQTVQTIAEMAAGQVKTEVIAGMPIVNLLPSVYSTEYNVPATRGPSGYTNNGITWKVDGLGRVTANGTATADGIFLITTNDLTSAVPMLPVGRTRKYTLQGCPPGGADSTYSLRAVVHNGSAVSGTNYGDTGSGVTFTPRDQYLYVYIRIMSGTTVSNLTFWPMLSEGESVKSYQSTHEGSGAMYSSIIQTAEQIALKVSQSDYTAGNIVGKINGSSLVIDPDNISLVGKTIALTSDNIKIDSTNFKVDKNGNITATGGSLGPWNFNGNNFWSGEEKVGQYHAAIVPDGITFAEYFVLGDPKAFRVYIDNLGVHLQIGEASGTVSDPRTYSGPWSWTTLSSYETYYVGGIGYQSRTNITNITAGDIATGTATVTGDLTVSGNINGYRTTTMHSSTRVLSTSAASQTFTFFGSVSGWELMTFRLDTGENLLGDSHFTTLKWTGTSLTVTRDSAASYGGRTVFFAFIKPV